LSDRLCKNVPKVTISRAEWRWNKPESLFR
jgi:hypothetical protein